MIPTDLETSLRAAAKGRVVVLTGAGISAESGIPTFRGAEGYWTVGAREYHPQEMATHATFERMPREVWRWYLYRRSVCRGAGPNAAHRALAQLEHAIGDRFCLITQNVDGLHLQAGSSAVRTCEVHGNIDYMRPVDGGTRLACVPDEFLGFERDQELDPEAFARLRMPDGAPARPHVLWFDEYYDETLFRSDTAMRAAAECDLLIVVGSSGAASLPMHATAAASRNGAFVLDINPQVNPFATHAEQHGGHWARGSACTWLPAVAKILVQ
jgi:NAD-dependent deacetylase